MKIFNSIFCMVFAYVCLSLQLTVGLENPVFNERVADFIDENLQGSGDVDVPFLLPEGLDEIRKINALEKIQANNLGIDTNGGEGNYEAITNAQLLIKEVVDTGEDKVKVAGAAMDLFEEIKEIPKEIHDSFKDSAKKAWNKAKKVSGHVMKIPNQVSDMWKKSSLTTEETSDRESGSRGGLFGLPRFG